MERGERDRQRTSRWDSNSGRRERSCAICRRTNHKAMGADSVLNFFITFSHIVNTNAIDISKSEQ